MVNAFGRGTALALGASTILAAQASAQVVLSFGFTDLNGSYTAETGVYSALAVGATSGDVTCFAGPTTTANFDPGFADGDTVADFVLELNVTNLTANSADGEGHFEIIDANGDMLSGDIEGQWLTPGFGVTFFNGLLSNVMFTPSGEGGDLSFDGTDGGSFAFADLIEDQPYPGAFIELFINTDGGFFDESFEGVVAQVDGEIVPAPATAALLGVVGLAGIRRRR